MRQCLRAKQSRIARLDKIGGSGGAAVAAYLPRALAQLGEKAIGAVQIEPADADLPSLRRDDDEPAFAA